MFEKNLNHYALFGAFVLYGLFSSPTPDQVSWVEITIGILLLLSVGLKKIVAVFSGTIFWQGTTEQKYLTGIFLISLYPALMLGFVAGHQVQDIIRDVIPLGFFFLAVFFAGQDIEKPILYGILFTGVLFALRFWPASGLTLTRFGLDRGNDELLYLTSSPSVLFSGLYLLFVGTGLEKRPLWWRVLVLAASLICLMTLVATLQRGALFLASLMIFFVFWHRLQRSPHFLYGCVTVVLLGGIWLAPTLADITALIWRKTLEVGDNARFAELKSVFDALNKNPVHYLTGQGWGTTIVTAASGYADVRYTHMLFSYTLLKTGLIGLCGLAGYGIYLGRRIIRQFPDRPLITCAALPSLILGFTLYPSFKMLCFGAILALLANQRAPNTKQYPESNA